MTSSPVVDVVIAVHDPNRRLDRALESLAGSSFRIRVTVVCHGIPASAITDRLPEDSPWIRVIEFADGIRSPAGPFNRGLQEATAEYVMIMGSDDFLEPGAMNDWIDAALESGADIQLAPLRHQNGELLLNPMTRPWRRHRLDPVRDRLFQRTAPLALIRRSLVPETPLSPDMPVGEDLAWSAALWTSGQRIDFDPTHPAYVIGADDAARITLQPRAVTDVLRPVDALLGSAWAAHQSRAVRASLVAKLLRVNVLGAVRARRSETDWSDEARAAIARTLGELREYAPDGFADLPRADRTLLDVAADTATTPRGLVAAIAQHEKAGRPARTLPRSLARGLGRESVLRRYARYTMDRTR